MEMELMENGLTQEEQAMQPDAVPGLEPGSGLDVPETVEDEMPEEPPKKKRAARKKTEKAVDDPAPVPGDTLEERGRTCPHQRTRPWKMAPWVRA